MTPDSPLRQPKPEQKKTRIRVLIIHEHAIIREGLRLLLERCDTFQVVGDAKTCGDAIDSVKTGDVDIVLLDTDLRAPQTVETLTDLMSLSSQTKLLVLTGVNDPELCQRAIECGAAGLFLKDQRCEVLVKAIETVAEGEVWLDRSLMAAVLVNLRQKTSNHDPEQEKIDTLTTREREIIHLISQGLRNREIAERLFIGEKTVRNHMASIFSKLEIESRLELSLYAHKHGLDAVVS
jgi:DNA-binding NarL/FixJ family response regulator